MRSSGWLALTFIFIAGTSTRGLNCDDIEVEHVCSEDCQFCQQQALLDYLWPLGGPEWVNKAEWPRDGRLEGLEPQAHCSWFGIYCCGSDNTLLSAHNPAELRYTYTNRTGCEVPLGVAIILLGNNNLNGSLNGSLFSSTALQYTMEVFRAESKSTGIVIVKIANVCTRLFQHPFSPVSCTYSKCSIFITVTPADAISLLQTSCVLR